MKIISNELRYYFIVINNTESIITIFLFVQLIYTLLQN